MTRNPRKSLARATGAAALGLATLGLVACVPPLPEVPPSPIEFVGHTVEADLAGAAFVVAAQVTGDPAPELVASSFGGGLAGPGLVTLHTRGSDLDDWSTTEIAGAAENIRFPNDPTVADLDADGDADVIVPGGFFLCEFTFSPCGSLQWFEQDGGEWIRHQVVADGNARFFHAARLADMDGDTITDIVTVSETSSSARVEWYRGTSGAERFESTPQVIGNGGGSLPVVHDVDGDVDDDIVSPQFFGGTGFVWFERTADPSPGAPAGIWETHVITTATAAGFAVEPVADLLGDGVDRWIASNHTGDDSAGVFILDQPTDPTGQWTPSRISQGIRIETPEPGSAAPGVIGHGDIDGDGDIDVAVSGDGDPRIFWLRQEDDDTFSTFVVDQDMGQAGGALVVDLDGDGANELVFSSYERDTIEVYSRP